MVFDCGQGTKRRGLTLPLLLTVSAVALTGCVSATDTAFTTGQGLSSSTVAVSSDLALADPSQASGTDAPADTAATTMAASAPAATPSAEQAEAAPSLASMAAPTQTAAANVDALNRGITQTGELRPVANLYSPGASGPSMVPVPTPSPAHQLGVLAAPAEASAAPVQQADAAPQPTATEMAALAPNAIAVPVPTPSPRQPQATSQVVVTTAPEAAPAPVEESASTALVEPPKKQSIFARLFNAQPTPPKPVPGAAERKTQRLVSSRQAQNTVTAGANAGALPGVRLSTLFEIKTGTEEDGEDAAGVEIASAAGLARLAPNGLHTQTDKVDVSCLKPRLIQVLRTVERHYGRDVVITSGYRSPTFNRRVGGASHSRHTTCEAADIQVAGVSKWELARYLRSMPGRGGVGTYCHTESVHVDIGSERDWNWRCRRRK
jgi:Uncharacterized protein conserved in bacteria